MHVPARGRLACLATALLLVCTAPAAAQTYVTGALSSNATWTIAGSPYEVTGDVTLGPGVTLVIQPGVEVRFRSQRRLTVAGALIARGTALAPIRFTSTSQPATRAFWRNIEFSDTATDAVFDSGGAYASGSIIEHAIIEGAGYGPSAALHLTDASPLLSALTMRTNNLQGIIGSFSEHLRSGPLKILNSDLSGHTSSAIDISYPNHDIVVQDNWIHDNQLAGFPAGDLTRGLALDATRGVAAGVPNGTARIVGNTFTRNGTGIYNDGSSAGAAVTVLIENNAFIDNRRGIEHWSNGHGTFTMTRNLFRGHTRGGLFIGSGYFGGMDTVTVTRNVIIENSSSVGDAGLHLSSRGPTLVSDNIISDNISTDTSVGSSTAGGVSVSLAGDSSTTHQFSHNLVARNTGGVGGLILSVSANAHVRVLDNTVTQNRNLAENTPTIRLSVAGMVSTMKVSGNNLAGNNATYTLQSDMWSAAQPFDATDNWWGTTDASVIASLVNDSADASFRPRVDADSPLSGPSTAAPLSPLVVEVVLDGTGTAHLMWSASTEPDVTGYRVWYGPAGGPPFDGTGASEGASPIDVGNVTTFSLRGLPPNAAISVTAYDGGRDGTNDQTDGNESWYARPQDQVAPSALSGTISTNTRLVPANSPYQVQGALTVAVGATLTIEPGVDVRFPSGGSLRVLGTLIARGTAGARIRFTSSVTPPVSGWWRGITFDNGAIDAAYDGSGAYISGSIIEHATVEGAGSGGVPAIEALDATPLLRSLIVRSNAGYGIKVALTAGLTSSPVRILDSEITGNGTGPVYVVHPNRAVVIQGNWIHDNLGSVTGVFLNPASAGAASGSAQVLDNTIANNGSGLYIGGGVAGQVTTVDVHGNSLVGNGGIGGFLFSGASGKATVNVTGNLVRDNRGGGININSQPGGADRTVVTDNIVTGNSSAFNAGLTVTGQGGTTVSRNIVSDNTSTGSFGGGGVSLLYWPSSAPGAHTFSNNLVTRNRALSGGGIRLDNRGVSEVRVLDNTVTANSSTTAGRAAITISDLSTLSATLHGNNIFGNQSSYALEHTGQPGAPPVDATGNWWGTPIGIESLILDANDLASYGDVDVSSPLAGPATEAPLSPPTGVTLAGGIGTATINFAPNPEPDVLGYRVWYGSPTGPPYLGTGASEGPSPIDIGNATSFTLRGAPAGAVITVTAYDSDWDRVSSQTRGHESWYAPTLAVSANRSPVVNGPSDQSHLAGTVVSVPITAIDPDGQTLTYSAAGLPPGISIDPASGVMTGTVAGGLYSVTVSASDGLLIGIRTFNWRGTEHTGSGIAGTVTDSASAPIAGATITVYSLAGTIQTTALTNLSGRYATTPLATGSYRLRATSPAHLEKLFKNLVCRFDCPATSGTPFAHVAGSGVFADFQLEPGYPITGTVSAAGTPIAGVGIWITSPLPYFITATTNAQGAFRSRALPPGSYGVHTHNALGYADVSWDGTPYIYPATTPRASLVVGPSTPALSLELLPNTPAGTNVFVNPKTPNSVTGPLDITFASVSTAGRTTFTSTTTHATPPMGYNAGSSPWFYQIASTAAFSSARVCMTYVGLYPNVSALRMLQFDGAAWTHVTTSLDLVTRTICGTVTSFAGALVVASGPPPPLQLTSITASTSSPQSANTTITFTAAATGGTGPYQYKWWVYDGNWRALTDWGTASTYPWTPATPRADYQVGVWIRSAGSTVDASDSAASRGAIPFVIAAAGPAPTPPAPTPPATGGVLTLTSVTPNAASPQVAGTAITVTANVTGGTAPYQYKWWLYDGTWHPLTDWGTSSTYTWTPTAAQANYQIGPWVRSAGSTADASDGPESRGAIPFVITATGTTPPAPTPPSGALVLTSLTPSVTSPQASGTAITLTAATTGGTAPLQYKWWLYNGAWIPLTGWGTASTYTWTPTAALPTYQIGVWIRSAGSTVDASDSPDSRGAIPFVITAGAPTPPAPTPPALVLTSLTPSVASPQASGTAITVTAAATGGTAPYQYKWWLYNGAWIPLTGWGTAATYTWTPDVALPTYQIGVWIRSAGSTADASDSPDSRGAIPFVITASGAAPTPQAPILPAPPPLSVSATTDPALSIGLANRVWGYVEGAPTDQFTYFINDTMVQDWAVHNYLVRPATPAASAITISASATGGSGPYQYKWSYRFNRGPLQLLRDWTTSPTLDFTPPASGEYQLELWASSAGSSTNAAEAVWMKYFVAQ
jgi:hypothetical protein